MPVLGFGGQACERSFSSDLPMPASWSKTLGDSERQESPYSSRQCSAATRGQATRVQLSSTVSSTQRGESLKARARTSDWIKREKEACHDVAVCPFISRNSMKDGCIDWETSQTLVGLFLALLVGLDGGVPDLFERAKVRSPIDFLKPLSDKGLSVSALGTARRVLSGESYVLN